MANAHRWMPLFAAFVLPVAAACDLKAEFIAPTGSTHNGAKPLPWQIRFSNVGTAGDCPANQVSLVRQPENPAQAGSLSIDGAGSLSIGGASSVTLHALAPKGSVTLRLVENSPPKSGTYVYRLSYTSKFLDANEHNHRPTKSISFHASYTIGG